MPFIDLNWWGYFTEWKLEYHNISNYTLMENVNLDVNAEKTKYMLMFRHQNAECSLNIKTGNKSVGNVITAWRWVLLEKPPFAQLLKNLPTFYGTWSFITMFTRARNWSLSWARKLQSVPPHPISLRFILILSHNLRLGLTSGLFSSGFPTENLYALNVVAFEYL
jgi:hypothetical protein